LWQFLVARAHHLWAASSQNANRRVEMVRQNGQRWIEFVCVWGGAFVPAAFEEIDDYDRGSEPKILERGNEDGERAALARAP